jgi:hypothetical protein
MDSETPVTYAVQIISVRDETAKNEVASALTLVAKNIPEHRIRSRLDRLPWVVAQTGVKANAERLVKMCNRCGAEVEVTPPLLQATAFMTTPPLDGALPAEQPLSEGPQPSTSKPETETRSDEYLPKPVRPARQTPEPKFPAAGGQPATVAQHTKAEDGWFSEPLSVTGILNRTFDICKTHFWNLAATSGILSLALGTVRIACTMAPESDSIHDYMLAGPGHMANLVLILGAFFQQGAVVYAVSSIYLGRETPIRDSYRFAWRKARQLVLTAALVLLILFGLTCAFIIAGAIIVGMASWMISITYAKVIIIPLLLVLLCVWLYVLIKSGLFVEMIVIEGASYSNALRRSWNLLSGQASNKWPKGYFPRFAILFAIDLLIYFGICILFEAPGMAMWSGGLKASGMFVSQLAEIIADILGGTFGTVCGVVFYYDIKSRKEGFDLQQLANQVSR